MIHMPAEVISALFDFKLQEKRANERNSTKTVFGGHKLNNGECRFCAARSSWI